MIDWAAGYRCSFGVRSVNQETWGAQDELAGVYAATVTRSCAGEVPLLEQAAITVDSEIEPGWYRITALVEQGGAERVDIGTFLFEGTDRTDDYGRTTATAVGWSVLKPAERQMFVVGEYAPSGVNGAAYAASLLQECIPAPVTVGGEFELGDDIVFAPGTTKLAGAWAVLDAGGFTMSIAGDGSVTIAPRPDFPALVLDRPGSAMLLPTVSGGIDASAVPNRYYAFDGTERVVAVNDDPTSSVSYAARGMWVDCYDPSPARVNGETLAAYASRKLAEASVVVKRKTYTREFHPDVLPFSLVRCSLPEVDLVGDGRVLEQSLTLGYGITVQETLGFEVVL